MRCIQKKLLFMLIIAVCIFSVGCGQEQKEGYDAAVLLLENGYYEQAVEAFEKLGNYKDSAEKKLEAQDKLYGADYAKAISYFMSKDYDVAYEYFIEFGDYRDSKKRAEECLAAVYEKASTEYSLKRYESALGLFEWLAEQEYKDSSKQVTDCKTAISDRDYASAVALYDAKKYEEAIKAFKALNGYKDSAVQITKCETAIKDRDYDAAVALFNAKKYEEAIRAFTALNGYKDSAEKAAEAKMKTAKAGSVVRFGQYEQDNKTANGKEEIEWIVLDRQGTKLLLISKYALDCQPYNKEYKKVTWETCTLRTWLNGTFLNTVFSAAEQKQIVTTTVQNPDNSHYKTKGGNATTDRVFLLSIDEADKYFRSDSARACAGTTYAYAQGAFKAENGDCWWWLRSPGNDQCFAAVVYYDGSVFTYGSIVHSGGGAVRPALWIDLGS